MFEFFRISNVCFMSYPMKIFLYDSHNKRANIIYWVALTFEISIAFMVRLVNSIIFVNLVFFALMGKNI
jgi:hypothetical protein